MENAEHLGLEKQKTSQKSKIFNPYTISLLVFLLLFFKVISTFFLPPKPAAYASDLTIENIISAVNRERSMRNLTTLNTNGKLSLAAQSKASDMINRKYFSHTDPEGNYIWKKIEQAGYTPYLQLGENLAIEFFDTDSLVSAWMNSPTHRANILQESFKDQGMGLDFGNSSLGQYHSSIVNTFGTLVPPKIHKEPAPIVTQAQPSPAPVAATAPSQAPAKTTKPAVKKPLTSTPAGPAKTTTIPKPAQTAPVQTATPVAVAASGTPATNRLPIKPRQEYQTSQDQSFALADNSDGQTAGAKQQAAKATISSPAVSAQSKPLFSGNWLNSPYQTKRTFALLFGFVLLVFLLTDIKVVAKEKLAHLDKKINNLVVLIISIIVVAVMYWL